MAINILLIKSYNSIRDYVLNFIDNKNRVSRNTWMVSKLMKVD